MIEESADDYLQPFENKSDLLTPLLFEDKYDRKYSYEKVTRLLLEYFNDKITEKN